MKTDAQPSLFSRVSSLRLVKEELTTSQPQVRSPYLKAILSGSKPADQPVASLGTDKEAALRYIKISKMLKSK